VCSQTGGNVAAAPATSFRAGSVGEAVRQRNDSRVNFIFFGDFFTMYLLRRRPRGAADGGACSGSAASERFRAGTFAVPGLRKVFSAPERLL
jgi:hypothetical protein